MADDVLMVDQGTSEALAFLLAPCKTDKLMNLTKIPTNHLVVKSPRQRSEEQTVEKGKNIG
jgi:hypothetical protein